jgi:uncharacterized membrane protein YdjX (TVP38/TMEM64 family)
MSPADHSTSAPTSARRWVPLIAIALVMLAVWSMGWHRYLKLEQLYEHRTALKAFIGSHFVPALALYMAIYTVAVALSLPGGLVLTVTGGFLFGWLYGGPAAVVAATLGATIIFLIARSSLGETLSSRAGPWLARLQDGFRENALSYLLFLRLVPAFPFFVVNLVPAVLGVRLRTFVVATFLGIIPATLAFSSVGAGLDSIFDAQGAAYEACKARSGGGPCVLSIELKSLITRELVVAFGLLGVIALLPVAVKWWRGSRPSS